MPILNFGYITFWLKRCFLLSFADSLNQHWKSGKLCITYQSIEITLNRSQRRLYCAQLFLSRVVCRSSYECSVLFYSSLQRTLNELKEYQKQHDHYLRQQSMLDKHKLIQEEQILRNIIHETQMAKEAQLGETDCQYAANM